jgi:hypothetical protein
MFSKILSLEANFLDKPSIILAWPEINSLKSGWLLKLLKLLPW